MTTYDSLQVRTYMSYHTVRTVNALRNTCAYGIIVLDYDTYDTTDTTLALATVRTYKKDLPKPKHDGGGDHPTAKYIISKFGALWGNRGPCLGWAF